MRKRFSPALLVLALGACTVHDAADPVADVDRTDLAGSYQYTEYFPEWEECLFAWLDLTAGGSFAMSYGSALGVTAASGCAAQEATAQERGGWEGSYANLGTYIAFQASNEYVIDLVDGTRTDYEYRTDLTGRYDPAAGSIAVLFADPWGFGEGGGGGKAGGKEEGDAFSELLFLPD